MSQRDYNDENQPPPRRSASPPRRNRPNAGPRMGFWLRQTDYHPFANPTGAPLGGASHSNPVFPPTLQPSTAQDPPPPYSPPSTVRQGPACSAGDRRAPVDGPTFIMEVPHGTWAVGAEPLLSSLVLSIHLPFHEGMTQICQRMGVDLRVASIGYKFSKERARDPIHRLADQTDWRTMTATAAGMIQSARSRQVTCRAYNLDPPSEMANTTGNAPTRKRRRRDASPPREVVGTAEFRQLKAHLQCAKHAGALCHVDTRGEHRNVDIYLATLWAKEIAIGSATVETPPNNSLFDDFYKHKRPRTGPAPKPNSSQPTTSVPEIHVHVNNNIPSEFSSSSIGASLASSMATVSHPSAASTSSYPLNEKAGMNMYNTETSGYSPDGLFDLDAYHSDLALTDEVLQSLFFDNAPSVTYPSTLTVLQAQDQLFPFCSMSQYYAVLCSWGLGYVDSIGLMPRDFFLNTVGMPSGMVDEFIRLSAEACHTAEKGKQRAD